MSAGAIIGVTSDLLAKRGGTVFLALALAGTAAALAVLPAPQTGGASNAELADQRPLTFAERFVAPANVQFSPVASLDQLERAKSELALAMQNYGVEADVADDPVPTPQVPKIPLPRTRPLAANLLASLSPPLSEPQPSSPNPLGEVSSALRKVFAMVQPSGPVLASAAPDGGMRNDGSDHPAGMVAPGHQTALYDISARTVYMPDGTRLEAHSGFRDLLDDVRYVDVKDRGATPPQVYELTPREKLFHGVQALRMTPVGEGDLYGRNGLLAHSYMLGPNGDSNGCVSFKDYDAFLKAFQNGSVKKLVVVKTLATESVADSRT
ncbi:MAG: hypothetical protein JWQ94_4894 [Tardiphaga sp.]|nr:hypothetical protein [Tardiphaga sp.]